MKQIMFSLILMLFAVNTNAQWIIEDAEVEVREVDISFTKMNIEGNLEVYIVPSDTVVVVVSGNKLSAINAIRTKVENGILYISGGGKQHTSRVYVACNGVTNIQASGNVDITATAPIQIDSMMLSLSGRGKFTGRFKIRSLDIDLSGASDAIINGDIQLLNVTCSGASDLKGPDLIVQQCNAHASGASDIEISSIEQLNARATGVSRIMYHNIPSNIKSDASAGSKIVRVVKQ